MAAQLQPDGRVSGDFTPTLLPLRLEMVGCATVEEMHSNTDATRLRGYAGIIPLLESQSGACSIVGSAPSIKRTLPQVTGDVLAVNSAIKYCLENGVVPKWAMIWDAADICEAFAVPHPDVHYLIAARCHPSVFKMLEGCRMSVWFAGGDHDIMEYMQRHELPDPLVNGGSAGVTRAMYLAVALGYRHLHIFGADSSYSEDGATHITGSLVPEKDLEVYIGNGEGRRKFRTTPEWCAQVNEFRDIYAMFCHPNYKIAIDVYGEGMLPRMAELMKAKEAHGLIWNQDGTQHPSFLFGNQQSQEMPPIEAENTQPLEETIQ